MIQFKTVALPQAEIKVKGKDIYTLDTANKVLAPIGKAIQDEAKGGWNLHSYVVCPAIVERKIGLLEKLLGPIPLLGILFRSNKPDYSFPDYCMLIFSKEV